MKRIVSQKTKEKIRNTLLGHKVSMDTRKKMSTNRKGKCMGDKNPSKKLEVRKKISESNIGKKRSIKTIEKLSISHKGKHSSPDTEFKKGQISLRKGVQGLRGDKNGNWKGGTTSLLFQIRHCSKCKIWRKSIFERDNFTCQNCFVRGGDIEAHHKKEFSEIIKKNNIITLEQSLMCQELWDINNGITLCKKCHDKTKKGRIKK